MGPSDLKGCVETLLSINKKERLKLRQEKTYKEIKTKTLDRFLSLYDGCVQVLPTHVSVQST